MSKLVIGPDKLSIDRLARFLKKDEPIELGPEARVAIARCRDYLDDKLKSGGDPIYGVTTGFGALCDVIISPEQLEELQINLVRSHACGTGPEVPAEIVKLMLTLKLQALSYGHSGISMETAERLVEMHNNGALPVVYQQGSLGASGDLCPLAHLSLPLIGEGELNVNGRRQAAPEVLETFGWEPLALRSKEGLALLNGTQFMAAYGVLALIEAEHLLEVANLCAALSLDARFCKLEPFDLRIQNLRRRPGQAATAQSIRFWLQDSEIAAQPKAQVQDSYSFRCTPQVHGATADALVHGREVLTDEINAVTDNPLIFAEDDEVLSGGNFHGQPLALAFDYMAMAVAELGNIAERRTYRLLSGERGLPAFLLPSSGLHSGLMIPQYTAAALVSKNKQLCCPASIDSIPSCNEQEDHVSMGANAAVKLLEVVRNTETVIAIAFMTAAQALHLRRPLRSSKRIESVIEAYRQHVPALEGDRILHTDIEATAVFLRELELPSTGS